MSSRLPQQGRVGDSSSSTINNSGTPRNAAFPLPAYLRFCPGGITYQGATLQDFYRIADYVPKKTATTTTTTSTAAATASSSTTSLRASFTSRVSSSGSSAAASTPSIQLPDVLVSAAQQADDRLRQYSLYYYYHHAAATASSTSNNSQSQQPSQQQLPYRLPSLSVLAEQVFGRLTGCPAVAAKDWADAMVVQYHLTSTATSGDGESIPPASLEDIYNSKPTAIRSTSHMTTAALLKQLLQQQQQEQLSSSDTNRRRRRRRTTPCGYVFQRGDIAWNCRTCQTDATCVICDKCFRNSDHTGHEVYFHRTTPGGCCDCGDAEAWKAAGCCDEHRPVVDDEDAAGVDGGGAGDRKNSGMNGAGGGSSSSSTILNNNDPMEAVRMATKGLEQGVEAVTHDPGLPPRLAAALGVVIGAAVKCLQDAVDGAGIGADPVQWKRVWADEAARIVNGVAHAEEYYLQQQQQQGQDSNQMSRFTPRDFWTPLVSLPDPYNVELRLHNDDVHTFDEVIEALHGDPRLRRRGDHLHHQDPNGSVEPLVTLRENATDMTHHVDSDGQVTVKTFSTLTGALQGYQRLKSSGLHCAVVSAAQVQLELRARVLTSWLSDICSAHPAAAALVVHALVQVDPDHDLGGVQVWPEARMIPPWAGLDQTTDDELAACRRRFQAFPPHLLSSYVTRDEAEMLHASALEINPAAFVELTGTDPSFYAKVPYRLPSRRYHKSPHTLWGSLPSLYSDPVPLTSKHPLLQRLALGPQCIEQELASMPCRLTESVYIVDTDLRKQQNPKILTSTLHPHKLPGLNMISGIGTIRLNEISERRPPVPSAMHLRHLLAISSSRSPVSPVLLMLLLDPYPTKQLRGALHVLFLSLLTDPRFRCRFAGALAVAYRPLSTLFCAGVGTEADTPLHFCVQILTAGSLVRALCHRPAAELLLLSDRPEQEALPESTVGVFLPPIAHIIVRCVHTNLLGSTQEVNMILKNTTSGYDDNSADESNQPTNDKLLPALTYVAGEHPLLTPLPAAPDDGFLDARSTRHKRLPHLLRDLEYVIETPGTAIRLLLPNLFPVYQGPSLSLRGEDVLSFPSVFARMLRLAQGMDTQKRKISGGHVEYEHNRWLEAFGLSLNLAGARDALAESPTSGYSTEEDASYLEMVREAVGNFVAALLREMKLWLYRESLLETGLPVPTPHGVDIAQVTSLQRSTLHVSSSQYEDSSISQDNAQNSGGVSMVALSCATGVKMSEAQLTLIENALKVEASMRQSMSEAQGGVLQLSSTTGPLIGDWLRVPHSPLAGDAFSFHLPLHRAIAKCVKSICSVVVPSSYRENFPSSWWKLPVLDDYQSASQPFDSASLPHHPLVPLLRSTLRSSNCRVNWSAGPDCTPQEAQKRRSRSRAVSANIAVAKVIHSLADHPMRCLAAAQQIERHLWARNGTSVAGMAMNYSNTPLCRSFRDLDLLMVQLSASGMSCGLGARRIFSMMLSRFSMDGYLCDPERRVPSSTSGNAGAGGPFAVSAANIWVNPPRLQDPDHAVILAESFFAAICVLVTELPAPPPSSPTDDTSLRQNIRRELLHALLAEPRSHSEAMSSASGGISRREESDSSAGGASLFSEAFATVLREIGKQKNRNSSRASTGPPVFELKKDFCEEYDPTFFHLKRQEHQHAMDVVARLRKQRAGSSKGTLEAQCLPLVCPPPKAHPRFLPCRLLLHLDMMDAAIRRSLLFALTNGSWLPPSEPVRLVEGDYPTSSSPINDAVLSSSGQSSPTNADVPVTTFSRRLSSGSSFARRDSEATPFSKQVVAASSVSFLEVLQLLTLQIHTMEECASLHRSLPDLDDESRLLSSGLSINSYLRRLIKVPESLVDVWALRPFPAGPLESKGSGERRGSILGLLVALYEHRADHASILDSERGDQGDQDHGGARALASSGLQWILRFVHSLVDGAQSVGVAVKCATSGSRINAGPSSPQKSPESGSPYWCIDEETRTLISGMLADLPDLWPVSRDKSTSPERINAKSNEAGKAAQLRALEAMKRRQAKFAETFQISNDPIDRQEGDTADLCIICRCDDADGDGNGPLGYLGHVQRSRVSELRASIEASDGNGPLIQLSRSYRVVGHMGCQLRETEAMDSEPLTCLPKGSIVTVLSNKATEEYGILSRRVLVQHTSRDTGEITEGWASIQSSHGYVILSPLLPLCFASSRWGTTRPVIKQCGHAAHLRCVETHTLSLHHRAASEQTFDGRFAANIEDGEFLCPLCKQLSNILIPRDTSIQANSSTDMDIDEQGPERVKGDNPLRHRLESGCRVNLSSDDRASMTSKALELFGSKLHSAMCVPWEHTTARQKRHQQDWDSEIQKWDYEDNGSDDGNADSVPRLLRQQLIAWSAVGHSAATLEACTRALEEMYPFGAISQTSDPWPDFGVDSKDKHPMLLELKRVLTGSSGLLQILCRDMCDQLIEDAPLEGASTFIGARLADILEGTGWTRLLVSKESTAAALWSNLAAFLASVPSHVARDCTIPQQCEARATAAAMWAVKGLGKDSDGHEVPAPLAVQQIPMAIQDGWGTMSPLVDASQSMCTAFRPGIASGFLYFPLLSWDLYTLSAAFFSTLLANPVEQLPSSREILSLARTLVAGRIIQAVITPWGFEEPDIMDLDEEDCWSQEEIQTQGAGLAQLVAYCRASVKLKSTKVAPASFNKNSDLDPKVTLAGVGRSILPFARALVLILRAFTAAIRERQRKVNFTTKATEYDELLDSFICSKDLMTVEDGFHFVKAMKGPFPSELVDRSGSWWPLVNKWLMAAVALESHHGSRGRTLLEYEESVLAGSKPHSASSKAESMEGDSRRRPRAAIEVQGHERNLAANNEIDLNDLGAGPVFLQMGGQPQDSEDEDEEMMQDVDMVEAEEFVGIAEQLMGVQGFQQQESKESTDADDSLDGYTSSDTEGDEAGRKFAHVSKSPILYYQPSLLGVLQVGPGRHGTVLDVASASAIMADLSHLGAVHRKTPTFSLVRLPKSFVELYNLVNKVKGRDNSFGVDEAEDAGNAETAICLLTGAVMRSGSPRRPYPRTSRQPGACTMHARKTGSGIGVFFLVQKCTVLLMHNNKSAYSPSLYVDSHGEEDPGLKRGRPLFLNEARFRALEQLWRQQAIPREVAQIRSTSDRVIRDSWY